MCIIIIRVALELNDSNHFIVTIDFILTCDKCLFNVCFDVLALPARSFRSYRITLSSSVFFGQLATISKLSNKLKRLPIDTCIYVNFFIVVVVVFRL